MRNLKRSVLVLALAAMTLGGGHAAQAHLTSAESCECCDCSQCTCEVCECCSCGAGCTCGS